MAICPIHGVDHEKEADDNTEDENVEDENVEDPNSEIAQRLEEQQTRLFRAITSFPLDHTVVNLSDNVRVHFLPDSRVTQEMRRDILSALREMEEVEPAKAGSDVYFPVPGETLIDVNPQLLQEITGPDGKPVNRSVLTEFVKQQATGQTFFLLSHKWNGTIDSEATMQEGARVLFLYEGLINADRKDPYDYPDSEKDTVLHKIAEMLGVPKEAPPKRPKHMFLAWSIFVPLIYQLVHEWAHVNDRRTKDDRKRLLDNATNARDAFFDDLSQTALDGGDKEAYSEAWVEWVATNGATQNVVAKTYAQTYNWPIWNDWDFPNDVRDFQNEPTINTNEVADNNPWAM